MTAATAPSPRGSTELRVETQLAALRFPHQHPVTRTASPSSALQCRMLRAATVT